MTENNLATALAAFQAEMPIVAKGKTAKVPTKAGGSYSYTYAGLADVSEVAMPLLTKHGLSFVTLPRMGDRSYELVGRLLHTSGEHIEGALPISGNTPQEMGSSLTYMRRYLMGCMTGLVTDDDDDGQLASKPAARKPVAKPAPETGEAMKENTRKQMFALFTQKGVIEAEQLTGINAVTGGSYASRADLTEADALAVIKALRTRPDAVKA